MNGMNMDCTLIDVGTLLPHSGRMLCIDRLLASSKRDAAAEVTLTADHSLVHDGVLHPAGHVELAAQTAGAMQGYDRYLLGLPPKAGFLVGAQDFVIHNEARVGDTVRVDVSIYAELGEMTVLTARLTRDDAPLAEGRLKVFVPQ